MALTTNPPVRPRRVEPANDREHRQLPARGVCLIRLPDVSRQPRDRRLTTRIYSGLEELDRKVFRYLQAIHAGVTSLGELSLSFLIRHPKWVAGAALVLIVQLAVIMLWTDSKPAVIDDLKTIAPPLTQSARADAILPVGDPGRHPDSGFLPNLSAPAVSTPAPQSPTLVSPLDGRQVDQVRPAVVAERPGENANDCFLPPQARANEAGVIHRNEVLRGADARMSSRPPRPVLPPPAPVRMDAPAATSGGASLEGRIIPQAGF